MTAPEPPVTVRADRVRVPFRRPFATSSGMWLEREAWLLRLARADGRVGWGEAVLEPADGVVAASVLERLVRGLVAAPPATPLPSAAELEQHGSPGRALRAAIDAARLDLGLEDGRALSGMLAVPGFAGAQVHGSGLGVGVNATLPALDPRSSAEAALQSVDAGFTTLKLKAGAERETDALVGRVRAVREAVGPDVRRRLDVNGAWDLETALERLSAVASLGLEYAEQPLSGDDPSSLADLRRRVRVPIAADEAVTSLRAARALLDADAVDVLVVKPARVGGPFVVAEIADLAAGHGVPVVLSTLFETGVGIASALAVAASLPDVMHAPADGPGAWPPLDHGLATAGLLEHDLLAESLVLEGGRLWAPGGPGTGRLGISVSEAAVERYGLERPAADAWDL